MHTPSFKGIAHELGCAETVSAGERMSVLTI